jgi:GntR family transcriptional regulator/MocR family aminotransferase
MDLHVSLRDRRRVSAELYQQIRDAILDGRLRARDALPSTRELSLRLQVSRNTVLLAYDRLCAEGFLTSRAGAGTFVGESLRARAQVRKAESPLEPRAIWAELPEGPDMSALRVDFDFRPGIPDASRFPFAEWRTRMSRQFQRRAVGVGTHIGAAGHAGLRTAIARHIGVSRAVRATADDVIVTNGSQQAIDLIARVLLEPGDLVAVEDPGYALPRRAFQAHGCRVVGVPVDDRGIVVDAIPARTRLVYVTPSHQYPLGMAMAMDRRQALLDWAQRARAAIVEDDYDAEFRYGGRPLEPLQSVDSSGRVLYVGSFSKILLPTLRLGFLVAPASLKPALLKAKFLTDWHTAVPTQAAAAQFIDDGLLARHIRRMRRVYDERHQRIRDLIETLFDGRLEPLPSTGGLHIAALLTGRRPPQDTVIVARARAASVALAPPLSRHYLSVPPRRGLLFGYGAIASDRIEEGLRRLRGCW